MESCYSYLFFEKTATRIWFEGIPASEELELSSGGGDEGGERRGDLVEAGDLSQGRARVQPLRRHRGLGDARRRGRAGPLRGQGRGLAPRIPPRREGSRRHTYTH